MPNNRIYLSNDVLKTLGRVGGIGGIGLGVFLYLFRDLIQKSIFTNLTETHSFILLLIISILVWSLPCLAMVLEICRRSNTPNGRDTETKTRRRERAVKPSYSTFSINISLVIRKLPIIIFVSFVIISGSVSWLYLSDNPLTIVEQQRSNLTVAWENIEVRSVRVSWDIARFSDLVSEGQTFYLVTTTADHRKYWRVSQISVGTGSNVFGLNEGQKFVLIVSTTDRLMKDEMAPEDVKIIQESELPK